MKQNTWLPKTREELLLLEENMLHSNEGWLVFCQHGRTRTTTGLIQNLTSFKASISHEMVKSTSPSNRHGPIALAACLTLMLFASDFVKLRASVLSMLRLLEFPVLRDGLAASIVNVGSFVDVSKHQKCRY